MSFTVSCPACRSRFSLGSDLFRRRVAGNRVKVLCRNCSAEITVDATEPATLPSNEVPTRGLVSPRPITMVTQLGLGGPAPPAPSPTATPLAGSTATPLAGSTATPLASPTATPLASPTATPLASPTATPLASPTATPLAPAASVTPLPVNQAFSTWDSSDSDPTIAIRAPKLPPRRPVATKAARATAPSEPELELIEAEEIPESSSDAPTLEELKVEAAPPKPARRTRRTDDFLLSLSAGTPNLLGAPTIDVSGLGTPNPATVGAAPPIAGAAPPIADPVLPDIVKEEELEYLLNVRTARSGTVPLFDMTAVLPAASSSLKSASPSSAATREVDKPRAIAPTSSGRVRERKFVIAPETSTAPRARRSSAALWFGLFAVAASIAVAGGLRARRPTLASVEPRAMLSAAPVVSSPIATVAAALPAPEDSAGNAALPAPEASVANAAPSAAFPNHPTPGCCSTPPPI